MNRKLDIVIPVYRNSETITELVRQLGEALAEVPYESKIIFVEDCGNDGSRAILKTLCGQDPRLMLIEQPRNSGQHASIARGLSESTGDVVVVMDADLQHSPRYLRKFLEFIEAGNEVVIGRAHGRHRNGVFRNLATRCWYAFTALLGDSREHGRLICYSAITRNAVNRYLSSSGCGKLYLGVLTRLPLQTAYCDIRVDMRPAGQSSYGWRRLLRLAGATVVYRFSPRA